MIGFYLMLLGVIGTKAQEEAAARAKAAALQMQEDRMEHTASNPTKGSP